MSKEIVQITDYDDANLQYVLSQWINKDNFIGIIKAENLQANDTEDALFEIRDLFWIDTAEGDQLDILGDIQNETRQGRTDVNYRKAIKTRIIINNGSGEPETIYTALTDIYGATTARVKNAGNAHLDIYLNTAIDSDDFTQIEKIIAAGVAIQVKFIDGGSPFVFFDDTDTDGEGFAGLDAIELEVDSGGGVVDLEVDGGSGVEALYILDSSGEIYEYTTYGGKLVGVFYSAL